VAAGSDAVNEHARPGLSYRRAGEGHALVMVHGFLGGSRLWRDQILYFAPRRDVIAPDLAGFADSADLLAPERIEGHAEHVLGLLDRVGVSSFDLIGHSMGGMIAQQMSLFAPDRVSRLVLYGTGSAGTLPDRFESIATSRRRVLEEGVPATARRIATTWFLHGPDAPAYALCEAEGSKATIQAALASLSAWEAWDITEALPSIRMPTLIVWGEHDRSIGWPQTETLWRGIPHASLAVIPGCSHNVHLERPELFNTLIGDFLGA
jgi:pimeloyl-ACP methyl ester carboxylesterase